MRKNPDNKGDEMSEEESSNESEETVVIVGPDGKQVEEGGSGTILRGEDADKYLAGENVSIAGVGMANANDGLVDAPDPGANAPASEDADSDANEDAGSDTGEAETSDESNGDEPPSETRTTRSRR